MLRYHWVKPTDLPKRLELIDKVTAQKAATIVYLSRHWYWKRITSVLIHGAPPAEGIGANLVGAKHAVLTGLPDSPAE